LTEERYRVLPAHAEDAQFLSQWAAFGSAARTLPLWGDGTAIASMLDRKRPSPLLAIG
jgi:hypothetical protein